MVKDLYLEFFLVLQVQTSVCEEIVDEVRRTSSGCVCKPVDRTVCKDEGKVRESYKDRRSGSDAY